jgi:proteasome lid subunit RPN8/RPN11
MMLALPQALRDQLERDASAAAPRECCGLIEGTSSTEQIRAEALHPTRNLAFEPDSFAIDPVEQFRLLRVLRGSGRDLIGCYHSHPNGRATPSQKDGQGAGEEGFVWLIAAVRSGGTELAAFVWRRGEFHSLPIAPT